jgi:hypothetical protein
VGQFKTRVKRAFEKPTSAKKVQFTEERVEYNIFLFGEPLKGSKSLKIFKISLPFRFDKLSHLSKSVHAGENSQILTVSNKKKILTICFLLASGIIILNDYDQVCNYLQYFQQVVLCRF